MAHVNDNVLESIVNKVVSQVENDLIAQIESSYAQSLERLRTSRVSLEAEYSKIVENASKQAENLKRQIIESSRLAVRNKQLLLIEDAVNNVFKDAISRIDGVRADERYEAMMRRLIEGALDAISTDAVIECNDKDRDIVDRIVLELQHRYNFSIEVGNSIDCLGGIRARSKDGSIILDNTLDSRMERLKPILKKDIARLFMV
ncbi:MAG: V-type ATP synthase subunit E [Candidatus Nitrosocaldus sp.]